MWVRAVFLGHWLLWVGHTPERDNAKKSILPHVIVHLTVGHLGTATTSWPQCKATALRLASKKLRAKVFYSGNCFNLALLTIFRYKLGKTMAKIVGHLGQIIMAISFFRLFGLWSQTLA